eukprot:TRINITY_DN22170_c0_g1_i1.p1 TRINITY_DN22170_c0_g1~~TRINITY_DN22170_c0_g1_i1.p1  ORF type:complete len:520 (+),score=59.05 TRINITY_DN22170_c0_g1_i1:45-1562(+)
MPENDDDVLPYSPSNEVGFFFGKGVPLGMASLLQWGIPPLLSMIFAGHTDDSAQLQASLGYARVWFNCTVLMPCFGMGAYFSNVVPGCIGAKREDRIPRYVQRSILLTYICMIPMLVLQFFAGRIMHVLGVPIDTCRDIDEYCRWMVIMAVLLVVCSHLDCLFVNMGYAKCTTFNSFLTGLGIDVACTYLLILKWQWGVFGSALAQIIVQASRIIVWLGILLYFNLQKKCFVAPLGAERIFTKAECVLFIKLAIPQMLGFFAGWLIFEFQLMAMTNIQGISSDALAAGAAWVQVESSLAAAQDGWISSASIRILNLLGKQDLGAPKAFVIFNALALVMVGLTNIPFVMFQSAICDFISNDDAVKEWLYKILWVLVPHTMTRVSSIICSMLFVPLGRGMFGTAVTFVSFYCIATPVVCYIALTNHVTDVISLKMDACVGLTSIAQISSLVVCVAFLCRLDWREAGTVIHRRANMDKRESISMAFIDPNAQAGSGDSTCASGPSSLA